MKKEKRDRANNLLHEINQLEKAINRWEDERPYQFSTGINQVPLGIIKESKEPIINFFRDKKKRLEEEFDEL